MKQEAKRIKFLNPWLLQSGLSFLRSGLSFKVSLTLRLRADCANRGSEGGHSLALFASLPPPGHTLGPLLSPVLQTPRAEEIVPQACSLVHASSSFSRSSAATLR